MSTIRYYNHPSHPWFQVKSCEGQTQASRRHTHDTLSVALVTGGSSTVWAIGEAHPVSAGQLVLIGPRFVHQCCPDMPQAWRFHMLHVEEDWLQASGLTAPGRPCFVVRDTSDQEYARIQHHFHALILQEGEPDEDVLTILDAALSGAASTTLRLEPAQPETPALQAVAQHIRDHVTDNLPLDALSEMAGLSRYALIRAFQGAYGASPHAWQNMLRLNEAQRLLASGSSILDIVHALGFYDQSHFSRLFKESTGMSPAQYQRSQQ